MREELERLATSLLEAFNNNDTQTVTDLVTQDIVYEGLVTRPDATGLEGFLGAVQEIGPEVLGTVSRWIIDVDSSTIVGEITWSRADISDSPRVPGILFITVEDNYITQIREQHLAPRAQKDCSICFPSPSPDPDTVSPEGDSAPAS